MKGSTKVKLIRKGRVHWETTTTSEVPSVELAVTSDIADFSKLRTERANGCIYCESTVQLSREHILPYALGGTTTIPRGSCEKCRRITHEFETAVLRGPMQMVRYIENMPSGTKHKDAAKTIPVKVTINDREVEIDAPRDEAPILLPFPVFGPPDYLDSRGSQLKLFSVVTGSFGADPTEFAKKYNAQQLEINVTGHDAIAFARMLAKIAYGNAHAQNQLGRVKDKTALVCAMMEVPDTIGQFVGTVPSPFKKYPGVRHRISLHDTRDSKVLFSEVQLFASAGAPTYAVILGTLNDDDSSLSEANFETLADR